MTSNRCVILAERPRYIVPTANCFRMGTCPVPELSEDGGVLLRTLWLGMDSTLYSRVQRITTLQKDPVPLKTPMVGWAVGRVEQSRYPRHKPGDLVSGFWQWQDYAVVRGERLRNLDFGPQKPSYALGAFGLAGFGAYIAVDTIAPVKAGETVVVGTVLSNLGHLTAQIAKLMGARVVGIAGTPEKCQLAVEKLGIDASVNRQTKDFEEQLKAACPRGVDVYVDTLGGRALDAVTPLLNVGARIAAVGQMSQIASPHFGESMFKSRPQNSTGKLMAEIIARRISVRGMITQDHVKGRVKEFDDKMKAWIDQGKVKPMEDIVVGLEKAPDALQAVFEGLTRGTRLVKVAD